ncbi:MAG: iron-regulated protein [Candidatus Omnitrophica bacterium]|nr:iron-regulated protein [Candidatus Omnitrophota bacterium]
MNKLALALLIIILGLSLASKGYAYDASPQIDTYSKIVYQSYKDSYESALQLRETIHNFVDNPTETALNRAKQAWLNARKPYGQTEGFRFYEGPIDFVDDAAGIEGPEGRLNAWPLDEAYIDYVRGEPYSGIVNDTDTPITRSLLIDANQADDESEVSTGYHAIEFLLWGQDFNSNGPGSRPISDYTLENPVYKRRAAYLKEVTDLLVDDLKFLVDAWDPDKSDNYAAEFQQMDEKESLSKIMTGLATLAGFELASERMGTPLDSGDQEDEHSCFSDNTHNDFLFNEMSIQNVYLGRYGSVKGEGLDKLVAGVDPQLDQKIKSNMAETISKLKALETPIDSKILATSKGSPSRATMEEAVKLLQTQADLIKEAGTKLELNVEIVE